MMKSTSLHFAYPSLTQPADECEFIFGSGKFEVAGEIIARTGKNVLVVQSLDVENQSKFDSLYMKLEALGSTVRVVSMVDFSWSDDLNNMVLRESRNLYDDVIVGIGDSNCLNVAKAIVVAKTFGQSPLQPFHDVVEQLKKIPLIGIPTSLMAVCECSGQIELGHNSRNQKRVLHTAAASPTKFLCDPVFSKDITISEVKKVGRIAMTQALTTFKETESVSDADPVKIEHTVALQAISLISKCIQKMEEESIEATSIYGIYFGCILSAKAMILADAAKVHVENKNTFEQFDVWQNIGSRGAGYEATDGLRATDKFPRPVRDLLNSMCDEEDSLWG